ncbi:MAG: hypothetical protein V4458_06240 [Pseudomonadota bacterium]
MTPAELLLYVALVGIVALTMAIVGAWWFLSWVWSWTPDPYND